MKPNENSLRSTQSAKSMFVFSMLTATGNRGKGDEVTPDGTIKFIDSIPESVEIVPTVYITTSAMEQMQLKEDFYAEKIYKRVNAMCRQNNIPFKEIQLDCD